MEGLQEYEFRIPRESREAPQLYGRAASTAAGSSRAAVRFLGHGRDASVVRRAGNQTSTAVTSSTFQKKQLGEFTIRFGKQYGFPSDYQLQVDPVTTPRTIGKTVMRAYIASSLVVKAFRSAHSGSFLDAVGRPDVDSASTDSRGDGVSGKQLGRSVQLVLGRVAHRAAALGMPEVLVSEPGRRFNRVVAEMLHRELGLSIYESGQFLMALYADFERFVHRFALQPAWGDVRMTATGLVLMTNRLARTEPRSCARASLARVLK